MTGTTTGLTLRQLGTTVYLPSAAYSTGLGAVAPVVVLSAIDLGASTATAALVVGMLGIGQIAGSLPAGVLTARIGERLTMIGAAALAVPALAIGAVAGNVLLLGLAVAMIGFGSAAWMVARLAYLTEAVDPALRARAMSTLGGVSRAGVFAGPFLGAGAMHLIGLTGAYVVALVGMALATALLILLPPVTHDRITAPGGPQPRLWTVLRDNGRTLRTLGVAVLLVGALRAARQTILPLWGAGLGLEPATIGLIYGLSGAVDMLLFYPAGWLMDRFGRRWAAVPAMTLLGLAHLLMPVSSGLTGLVLIAMLMGLGNGFSAGLMMTIGADVSPREGRAQFLSAWRLCSDVGAGGGPLLIGAVTAVGSLTAAALTVGAAGFLAAFLLFRWAPRGEETRPGAAG
ncbi:MULTISPECIES: MFS transporter [Actinoplanes]|uniref:MFS transporter n=1 Tax=Actinoplanes TaxID=1865 RepID=UPI0005F2DE31|nr:MULTISPECIES: MFS transporter [Actinoplanes]